MYPWGTPNCCFPIISETLTISDDILQYDFSGNDLYELDEKKSEELSCSSLFFCVLSAVSPLHTIHLETFNP